MSPFSFHIEKKMKGKLGRAGTFATPHGVIKTPTFAAVGTKATVKALTPEQIREAGAQVVLGNTYHLYLEPGEKIVKKAGGLGKFMGWDGPTMTDSGGFQVFSLGAAFGEKISKIGNVALQPFSKGRKGMGWKIPTATDSFLEMDGRYRGKLVKIGEDGVTFKSYKDGSERRFTPERSIEIQHDIGADIIFAFDECVSPEASKEYQKEAMERTHRWAIRSLMEHKRTRRPTQNKRGIMRNEQELFGIVQGGRFADLRKKSAKIIGKMDFEGFGIGGSFEKSDMGTAVRWVNEILPEEKPRHLLGIGEPLDLFDAVENGCDLFDCVAPTRQARNGTLYTASGKINIGNARYKTDFTAIEKDCECYACRNFTKAYLSHLFRSKEILANTLATIHNLYFIVNLLKKMRQGILDDSFRRCKKDFFDHYNGTKEIFHVRRGSVPNDSSRING